MTLTMSQKELDRVAILGRLLRREIKGPKAAQLLGISSRQVRTLKKKFSRHGPSGLIHGNRGKSGHRSLPKDERRKVISLLHRHYYDFGPTFASEKLAEKHGIIHDPKTIRAIMIDEALWTPHQRKKSEEHREWRKRKDAFGEMIQFDGSYHDWFEGRADTTEQCLLAAIDDATGTVPQAFFAAHEGVLPVLAFWQDYTLEEGKPRSIYLDKFSTYKMNQRVAVENPDTKTQFQRVCQELGIQPIFANSPQAKGRVEKLFRTFQDRLIKELRLAGISTIEEANRFLKEIFLPKFNARFSVQPASKANLHSPLSAEEKKNLASTFSRHTERTVQNDFTLAFNSTWYQLIQPQPCTVRKKERVTVEERLDGSIHIRHRGKELNYEILPMRPKKTKDTPWILAATRPSVKPAANHPWRTFHYGKNLIQSAK